ncbi:DNA repair protein rad26 [Colletotrichum truncatum]|uniref:DNA repair protein rad26 n=1 Tax=Colletotrichum truncatum TaxID=5467 RepID=A0ACC3ZLM9_COLTU|nr:DNA repair protein rad26 [Colletotrichum truncatum]KAF6783991.1 DNA repair protein rad26 [Colletotrichum truncatum]
MDEYSDDEFDQLNDTTLQELEDNAIRLTQAQPKFNDSQLHDWSQVENYNDLEFEDDDLDDTEVTNELLPVITRPLPEKTVPQHHTHLPGRPSLQPQPQRWNPPPAPANPPPLSSRPRYPPPVPSFAPPAASQRFQPPVGAPYRPQPTQFGRPPLPSSTRYNPPLSQAQPTLPAGNDVVAALQQRLKALEAELNSTRGEVAIIRSNSTKAQQDHTAEIARLKKQNAEQAAKQERAVEAAVAAERQATTELQFLQRDMKDAVSRPRRKDTAQEISVSGTTTPKKTNKTWGMADGFDDMDIAPSPSKARGKTRDAGPVAVPMSERTPTKGKRKRPTVDSPVMALETHAEDAIMVDDSATIAPPVQYPGPGPNVLPFEFLQVILDHGSLHGEPPTFDILSRYTFPSDPATSFASLIFRELPLMGNPLNPVQLLVDFSRLIIRMWNQCLNENFLRPIWDLTSLLSFTLQLQTMSVVPQIINELVPTAQQSIYLVAEARFLSVDGGISPDPAIDALQQHVDTTYILSLLYASAAACATTLTETENGTQTRQTDFWQLISFDLVLVLLTPKQRLDDILGMLNMLCTSALASSVGPIVSGKEPDLLAKMIIDKVSLNLVDLPRAAVTTSEKHAVRFAVIQTLMAFARTPYGARQIAVHISVIPRLVTALSELVDALYDLSNPVAGRNVSGSSSSRKDGAVVVAPDDPRDDAEDWDDDRSSPSLLISQIVLLLHTLATDPNTANVANILSKLSMSHGGSQRYILSLSRLNFAEEDLIYEAGIDADTVDRAHELLEIGVTPDEGDSVAESFGV